MALVHEKGAALSDDASLRKETSAYPYVLIDTTLPGNPRSDRFSVRLDGWLLASAILGNAAIILGVLGTVWGA